MKMHIHVLTILVLMVLNSKAEWNQNQEQFANEALFAHNLYRKIHGVESVKLSDTLLMLAQLRADELAENEHLKIEKNLIDGQIVGEIVGYVNGFDQYTGISASQLWYSNIYKYEEKGELSSEGASFTQMVWNNTREVGFAIARSKAGGFYFVGEYFPSGNIRSQYESNVFQLTDELIDQPACNCNCTWDNIDTSTPIISQFEINNNNSNNEQVTELLETTTFFSTTIPTIPIMAIIDANFEGNDDYEMTNSQTKQPKADVFTSNNLNNVDDVSNSTEQNVSIKQNNNLTKKLVENLSDVYFPSTVIYSSDLSNTIIKKLAKSRALIRNKLNDSTNATQSNSTNNDEDDNIDYKLKKRVLRSKALIV